MTIRNGDSIPKFQSTLSRGERQKCLKFIVSWMIFQSTLSRGERHNQSKNTIESPAISIHALTRRAARMPGLGHDWYDISIHALTRRAATEEDIDMNEVSISIHALTRRAAYGTVCALTPKDDFNPRSHEESGAAPMKSQMTTIEFQSTLSRGERLTP